MTRSNSQSITKNKPIIPTIEKSFLYDLLTKRFRNVSKPKPARTAKEKLDSTIILDGILVEKIGIFNKASTCCNGVSNAKRSDNNPAPKKKKITVLFFFSTIEKIIKLRG